MLNADGSTRDEVYLEVPEVAPGESRTIVIEDVEMMLDPIQVQMGLEPNPGDTDPSNDTCDLYLGVQPPQDVECESVQLPDAQRRLAARVEWTSPLEYEQIDMQVIGLAEL